jgi:Uma2 family endonuclease
MAREVETEPLTLANRPVPPGKMTYEEFLDWADEETYAEWVDGEVVWMSPVSDEHEALRGFLHNLLSLFVEAQRSGVVRLDPFQMKIGPSLPGRAPDILFVASTHLSRIQKAHLEGPADLVVEIVSPESRHRDSMEKFGEYEAGGVPEYWLLDQPRRQAMFYELGEDSRYHPMSIDQDGVFRSKVMPGFWLTVEWLWQEPRPALLDVLREWGLI